MFHNLLLLLCLASCIFVASASCAADMLTFAEHPGLREQAAHCFFDIFGKDVLTEKHLTCAFATLPAVFRNYIGNDASVIMERCDLNPTDGKFTEAKILSNPCTCIHDNIWANRVNLVCNYMRNHADSWAHCKKK